MAVLTWRSGEGGRAVFVRLAARQQFEDEDADGVDIGTGAGHAAFSDFGGEVRREAGEHGATGPRGRGIGLPDAGELQLYVAVGHDDDVLAGDIAVHHSGAMDGLDGLADADRGGDRRGDTEGGQLSDSVAERRAADEVAQQVSGVALGDDFVNALDAGAGNGLVLGDDVLEGADKARFGGELGANFAEAIIATGLAVTRRVGAEYWPFLDEPR